MDYTKFFDNIRKDLFNGRLTQEQVNGISIILGNTEELNIQSRAYILATVYHETAKKMQPLSEVGKGQAYSYGRWQVNSKGMKYCYKNSRRDIYTEKECPHLFYGRGLVQLTWYDNYLYAEKRLKAHKLLDECKSLIEDPELANNPEIAINILKLGMIEGWFTGRKLDHYFLDSKIDYVNARRIINGFDRAKDIAEYADYFEKALRA